MKKFDYYPFGMMMPGRKYNAEGSYRYGFNGKEMDNEVKGEGNSLDFGARIYDPRLGKWFSVDPLQKKYAGFSPYNFVENNPNVYIDKDGRDKWLNILITDERTGKTTQLSILLSHEVIAGQRDLVPSFGNLYYYDWDDINLNYNITVSKDGKVNTTFTEERGKTQTTTMGKNALKAKMNIWYNNLSQKEADIGEGYLLQGKSGKDVGPGDPLGPGAKKVDIIYDAERLLAMVGNWREFGAKIEPADLIKELGGWEKVKRILESADNASDALSAIDDACSGCMQIWKEKEIEAPSENTSRIEPGKATKVYSGYKKGTILHTRTGNVRVESDSTGTCCQDDKKATDTVPSMKKNKNP